MLLKFILLFTIVIITIQGRIHTTRIEKDAGLWTRLYKEYTDLLPYSIVRGQMTIKCEIMLECCRGERDRFFDLIHEYKFEEICIGHPTSTVYDSHSKKCLRLIEELHDIEKSSEYIKFSKIIADNPKREERFQKWRSQMAKVCSTYEREAYYCETKNTIQFNLCQRKVLRSIADENDEEFYNNYVREMESDYRTYIQQFSEAFHHL
ncbi:unnamed protein product [Adineta steineri]|uniref:Uncharacterized protein n=1 Tax=Adineta steineri TaxID=433720 RepID=A0A815IIZ4_9BILA|nr:unnamed protein product [Adineta steineri]CAF1364312.1 unnamed protein product [Adineta steineri]